MPEQYKLSIQTQLLPPRNSGQIASHIQRELNRVNAGINVKVNRQGGAALRQLQFDLEKTGKTVKTTAERMESFGETTARAAQKIGIFVAAGTSLFAFIRDIRDALGQAIEFERQIIRVSQASGDSLQSLNGLKKTIDGLSTSLGVESKKLSEVALVLTQAGISQAEVQKSLKTIAQTALAPTFDDINSTVEGSISLFQQYKLNAEGVAEVMDSINRVSAKFAVESSDLITAVRGTGAVFKEAGGSINELLALFTSVRASTRESAESIATSFKTIFARLQRSRTQNVLKDFGIDLRFTAEEARKFGKTEGDFVGPLEAVLRLSSALKDLSSTDPRFARIVEEIGGFRQLGKVIPLIRQSDLALKALSISQQSSGSLAEDTAKAQGALATQIAKTREEFLKLFRTISEDKGFKTLLDLILKISNGLIKVAEAVTPLLPALAYIGAFRFGANFRSINTGVKRQFGLGLARGGLVPGSGHGDTVPAMLEPGEYVLRKDAVKSLGVNNVATLNRARGGNIPVPRQRYERGGTVSRKELTRILSNSSFQGYEISKILRDRDQLGQASDLVPTGSKLLGTGGTAVVLRQPDGDVIRIGQKSGQLRGGSGEFTEARQRHGFYRPVFRPNIQEFLKANSTHVFGPTSSDLYLNNEDIIIEKLPFAQDIGRSNYSALERERISKLLAVKIARQGYFPGDVRSPNIGILGNEFKIIDPESASYDPETARIFLKDIRRNRIPKDIHTNSTLAAQRFARGGRVRSSFDEEFANRRGSDDDYDFIPSKRKKVKKKTQGKASEIDTYKDLAITPLLQDLKKLELKAQDPIIKEEIQRYAENFSIRHKGSKIPIPDYLIAKAREQAQRAKAVDPDAEALGTFFFLAKNLVEHTTKRGVAGQAKVFSSLDLSKIKHGDIEKILNGRVASYTNYRLASLTQGERKLQQFGVTSTGKEVEFADSGNVEDDLINKESIEKAKRLELDKAVASKRKKEIKINEEKDYFDIVRRIRQIDPDGKGVRVRDLERGGGAKHQFDIQRMKTKRGSESPLFGYLESLSAKGILRKEASISNRKSNSGETVEDNSALAEKGKKFINDGRRSDYTSGVLYKLPQQPTIYDLSPQDRLLADMAYQLENPITAKGKPRTGLAEFNKQFKHIDNIEREEALKKLLEQGGAQIVKKGVFQSILPGPNIGKFKKFNSGGLAQKILEREALKEREYRDILFRKKRINNQRAGGSDTPHDRFEDDFDDNLLATSLVLFDDSSNFQTRKISQNTTTRSRNNSRFPFSVPEIVREFGGLEVGDSVLARIYDPNDSYKPYGVRGKVVGFKTPLTSNDPDFFDSNSSALHNSGREFDKFYRNLEKIDGNDPKQLKKLIYQSFNKKDAEKYSYTLNPAKALGFTGIRRSSPAQNIGAVLSRIRLESEDHLIGRELEYINKEDYVKKRTGVILDNGRILSATDPITSLTKANKGARINYARGGFVGSPDYYPTQTSKFFSKKGEEIVGLRSKNSAVEERLSIPAIGNLIDNYASVGRQVRASSIFDNGGEIIKGKISKILYQDPEDIIANEYLYKTSGSDVHDVMHGMSPFKRIKLEQYKIRTIDDIFRSIDKGNFGNREQRSEHNSKRLIKTLLRSRKEYDSEGKLDLSHLNDPLRSLIFGKYAKGGSVDNVPALLTPGEYVINKEAASKIGLSNLNRLNRADKVQKFAKGGSVKMAQGGGISSLAKDPFALSFGISTISFAFQGVFDNLGEFGQQVKTISSYVATATSQFAILNFVARTAFPKFAEGIARTTEEIEKKGKEIEVGKATDKTLRTSGIELKRKSDAIETVKGTLSKDRDLKDRDVVQASLDLRGSQTRQAIVLQQGNILKNLKPGQSAPGIRDTELDSLNAQRASLLSNQSVAPHDPFVQKNLKTVEKKIETTRKRLAKQNTDLARVINDEVKQKERVLDQTNKELDSIDKEIRILDNEQAGINKTRRQTRAYRRRNSSNTIKADAERVALEQDLSRQRRNQFVSSVAPAAIGTALTFGGGFLTSRGEAGLARGQTGEFVAGNTLSGAGIGAVTGFGIGAASGNPIVAAVLAVLGGATGALTSFVSATEEAAKRIRSLAFEKELERFGNALTKVNSGIAPPRLQVSNIRTGISSLESRLLQTSGDENTQTISQIKSSVPEITTFAAKIAESSKSLDEFKNVVGTDVINFLARWTQTPIDEVNEKFEKLIKSSTNRANAQDGLVAEITRQTLLIRNSQQITDSLLAAADSADSFSTVLNTITGTDLGNVNIRNPFSNTFDKAQFDGRLNQVGGFLGNRGRELAGEASNLIPILREIPDALLQIRGEPPLQENADPTKRLVEVLETRVGAIPEALARNIQTVAGTTLIGDSGDPKNFTESLKDINSSSDKLKAGLSGFFKVFEDAIPLINNTLNQYNEGLSRARQLQEESNQIRLQGIDVERERIRFRLDRTPGSTDFGSLRNLDIRERNTIFGEFSGNSVSQLSSRLQISDKRIEDKNSELKNIVSSPEKTRELQDQLNQEIQIRNKLISGLKYFGDVTRTTATSLEELNGLERDRESRKDLVKRFAFGSDDERREINRSIIGAIKLSQSKSLDEIPTGLRGGVLSLLESFGDTKVSGLGDKTGNQVLNEVLSKFLESNKDFKGEFAKGILTPSDKESELRNLVEQGFKNSIDANNALREANDRAIPTFLSGLKTQFDEFFTKLDQNLVQTEQSRLKSEKTSKESQLGPLNRQLALLDQKDIKSIAPDFESAQKLRESLGDIETLRKINERRSSVRSQEAFFSDLDLGRKGQARESGLFGFLFNDTFNEDKISALVPEFRERLKSNIDAQRTRDGRGSAEKEALSIREDITRKFIGKSSLESQFDFENLADRLSENISGRFGQDFSNQVRARFLESAPTFKAGSISTFDVIESFADSVSRQLEVDRLSNTKQFNLASQNLTDRGISFSSIIPILDYTKEQFKQFNDDLTNIPVARNLEEFTGKLGALNAELEDINETLIPRRTRDPQEFPADLPRFASGGKVPGTGYGDKVKALLSPEEFVIQARSARKIGTTALNFLNRTGYMPGMPPGVDFDKAIPRFASGGFVGGFSRFSNQFKQNFSKQNFKNLKEDLQYFPGAFQKLIGDTKDLTTNTTKDVKDFVIEGVARDRDIKAVKRTGEVVAQAPGFLKKLAQAGVRGYEQYLEDERSAFSGSSPSDRESPTLTEIEAEVVRNAKIKKGRSDIEKIRRGDKTNLGFDLQNRTDEIQEKFNKELALQQSQSSDINKYGTQYNFNTSGDVLPRRDFGNPLPVGLDDIPLVDNGFKGTVFETPKFKPLPAPERIFERVLSDEEKYGPFRDYTIGPEDSRTASAVPLSARTQTKGEIGRQNLKNRRAAAREAYLKGKEDRRKTYQASRKSYEERNPSQSRSEEEKLALRERIQRLSDLRTKKTSNTDSEAFKRATRLANQRAKESIPRGLKGKEAALEFADAKNKALERVKTRRSGISGSSFGEAIEKAKAVDFDIPTPEYIPKLSFEEALKDLAGRTEPKISGGFGVKLPIVESRPALSPKAQKAIAAAQARENARKQAIEASKQREQAIKDTQEKRKNKVFEGPGIGGDVGLKNAFNIIRNDQEFRDENHEPTVRAYRAIEAELRREFEERQRKEDEAKRRGFASGGYVSGPDTNRDSVLAKLMPGEFVMNKKSVNAIGVDNLHKLNKTPGYANGGQVQPQGGGSMTLQADGSLNAFNSQFAKSVTDLSTAISAIPTKFDFNHTVEVVHNGAQIFSTLQPEFQKMVVATVKEILNKFIQDKFPSAGGVQ